MKKISSLACLFTALFFCFDSQATQFAVVGEVGYSMPSVDTAPTLESAIGFGGGVLATLPVAGSVDLDIGALYSIHKVGLGVLSLSASYDSIYSPIKLQFKLGDSLALGAGGYVAYLLDSTSSSSITYGALGGLKLNLGSKAFLDVNYQYDLDAEGLLHGIKAFIGFYL